MTPKLPEWLRSGVVLKVDLPKIRDRKEDTFFTVLEVGEDYFVVEERGVIPPLRRFTMQWNETFWFEYVPNRYERLEGVDTA